jgi:hypothetical protein
MKIETPVRAVRTYTQRLVSAPDRVFPLLCPVREAAWIEGWEPSLVVTASGVAEPDCVFITDTGASESVWYVTRHAPETHVVEMIKITPGVTACRLTIRVRPAASGSEAEVTYAHTSLGPQGDEFVAGFTEAYYGQFMRDWESRLNHYLIHGTPLRASEGTS